MQTKASKRSISTDIERLGVIAPILDEIYLDDITDDLIHKKIVNGICKQRCHAPATINRYLDLIRSILNACVRWHYLDKAPSLEKPGQAGERTRKAWINLNQFQRAQKALSPLHAKIMTLSLCTGMRVDNILTLQCGEVDIQNKRIFIPANKFKGKVDHTVPLNKTAIEILRAEIYKDDTKTNVFTYRGKPIARINLRCWHKVFDDLGINQELRGVGLLSSEKNAEGDYKERFVFHGMRHTFATWLGRSGVPIEIIASIGGWSKGSKNKMVNIYTHMDDVSHLLPYVRNIDLILSGKKKV
jgi:integrase